MTVARILAEKGRDVTTTTAATSIADAIALLAHYKIGAIVVLDLAGKIAGIVSERDVVRAMAAGKDVAEPLSAIMTRTVVTCTESETINDVMGRMTRGRFRHLPVVESGKLTGIVSIGDVVRVRIEDAEREAEEMRAYIATA